MRRGAPPNGRAETTRLVVPLPARGVVLGRAQRGPSLASLRVRSRHDSVMLVGAWGAYEHGGDKLSHSESSVVLEIPQEQDELWP
jgi:hypothetical protein